MKDDEQSTADRFIDFLKAIERGNYQIDGRHVPNRAGTGNFDFHLTSKNGKTIALELTTLTPGGQEFRDSAHFDEVGRSLTELINRTDLPGSFMIHTPYGALGSLNKLKTQLDAYGEEIADEIVRAAKELKQVGEERELRTALDDIVVEKIDDVPGCLWFNGLSPNEYWGDYQGFNFVRDALKRALEKKNYQLDTPADNRILVISNLLRIDLITNRLRPPLLELVRKGIRQISNADPLILSNIDAIFFEGEPSNFEKVHGL